MMRLQIKENKVREPNFDLMDVQESAINWDTFIKFIKAHIFWINFS